MLATFIHMNVLSPAKAFMAPIAAIEIKAQIRPYSIAVAPLWLRSSLFKYDLIMSRSPNTQAYLVVFCSS